MQTVRFWAALMWLLPACAWAQETTLRVVVTVEPLRYLVERVSGDHAAVDTVVKAGHRPETYDPTPRQVAGFAGADVFFGVGMPLETALRTRFMRLSARPVEWVSLAAASGSEPEETGAEGDHDHHHRSDPHIWLSPVEAGRMVSIVTDVLSRLVPARAEAFRQRATEFRVELEVLHGEIAAILAGGADTFLVFHPAWGHFARTYGLEQIAIESEGKEPGPRLLTEIIDQARRKGVRTVFLEPQQSRRLAQTVATAIDGKVELLDPLAYDYPENLKKAARAIAASAS